jgi:hypothetical protein
MPFELGDGLPLTSGPHNFPPHFSFKNTFLKSPFNAFIAMLIFFQKTRFNVQLKQIRRIKGD